MAEMLVSIAVKQLISISVPVVQQELRLVADVKDEVENLSSELDGIQAVLKDAEEKQVKNNAVKDWLEDLKNVAYDVEDVCDEWRTRNSISQVEGVDNALIPWCPKVCSYFFSPCFGFSRIVLRHDIGHKIKSIRKRLDVIAKKNVFKLNSSRSIEEPERHETSSVIDISEICGRKRDKDVIISKLLSEEEMGLLSMSIVGMGGIGKTTLAQQAYNDDRVMAHFNYRMWVCVSDPFDKIRIAKEIIEAIGGNVPNDSSWDILHRSLSDTVKEKQFLLVLDDVWTDDYRMWEPLMHSLKLGAPRSRVLVTTRNEEVAMKMGMTYMHRLGTLSDEECWSLLRSTAFWRWEKEESEKMEEIGKEIAKKCKGLPLSAKTLGSLLRSKRTKREWHEVLKSEIWELKEVEKVVLPALLLSYYDLPSHLKCCFQYCAVFPKDYRLRKDSLINLWMAQGFIRSEGGDGEMEVKGEEYFSDLVLRSFFQNLNKDRGGSIVDCKMHDMLHDFAQFLTKNECFIMDNSNNARDWNCKTKARHSTVMDDSDLESTLSSIHNFKNLRTLKLKLRGWWKSLPALPSDLFCQLTCLRALDLSNTRLEALPSEVEKLILLRFLDLSYTNVRKLPETMCNLYNLQTLDLTGCKLLQYLPEGIGKLISLRHLEIHLTHLRYLPRGIGKLSSLRKLHNFIVGGGEGGCKIGDLENLNLIRGNLSIDGLGYEENVNDARKAELRNKQHLRSVKLSFDSNALASVGGGEEEERMEGVIEGLEPHPDLEKLAIWNYPGAKFPKNWLMTDDGLVLSTSLVSLNLRACKNFMQFPPSLGKLPSLQKLEIERMDAVRYVGREFFGIGDSDEGVSLDVFPKLTKLYFRHLTNWKEWDMAIKFKDGDISIMPRLNTLVLHACPKLEALPPQFLQNRPLMKLFIISCPILQPRCQTEEGGDWNEIFHIPNITINGVKIQSAS